MRALGAVVLSLLHAFVVTIAGAYLAIGIDGQYYSRKPRRGVLISEGPRRPYRRVVRAR